MYKAGKKKSPDPVQQQLRDSKDSWNGDVRSFTKEVSELRNNIRQFNSNLIEYKKLINGYPSIFHKEKGDIKYPIPVSTDNITSSLSDNFSGLVQKITDLSQKFNDISQKSSAIVSQQASYSQTRKKKKAPEAKQAAVTDYQLISEASSPFSRLFSTIVNPVFSRENWIKRKSWIEQCVNLKESLNKLDFLVLGTDIESISEATVLLKSDIFPKFKLLYSSIAKTYREFMATQQSESSEQSAVQSSQALPQSTRPSSEQSTTRPSARRQPRRETSESASVPSIAPSVEFSSEEQSSERQPAEQGRIVDDREQERLAAEKAMLVISEIDNIDPDLLNFITQQKGTETAQMLHDLYERSKLYISQQQKAHFPKRLNTFNSLVALFNSIKSEFIASIQSTVTAEFYKIDNDIKKYGQYYVRRWLRKLKNRNIYRIEISDCINQITSILNDMMDSLESGLDVEILFQQASTIDSTIRTILTEMKSLSTANLNPEQAEQLRKALERRNLLEQARNLQ